MKEMSEALDIPKDDRKQTFQGKRVFEGAVIRRGEKPATGKNSKRLKRITGKGKMSC